VSWPYNTVTDNNDVVDEAQANLLGIWDFIKNSGAHPDSLNHTLQWIGNVPCKREGRRFVGQYVSTQNDIMSDPHAKTPQAPALYYDRVAYAGWGFDLHNPKGMRDPSHPPYESYKTPYMFSTPLRSLVSKDNDQVMFAGRLASFSHVVFGSQRVMKTGSTMGQAAGTAAAYAVLHGVTPADLKDDPAAIWSIQQQLIRDDAYVIGLRNEDPRDHAQRQGVRVTASSEWHDVSRNLTGSAANVVSGQTRAVVHPGGVAPGQGLDGTNRWISNELPASLTLDLSAAPPSNLAAGAVEGGISDLTVVEVVFDTGMHRKLTHSVVTGGVGIWAPQPETVRDYTLEGRDLSTGEWRVLCNVTNNFQRRVVHTLPCPPPSPSAADLINSRLVSRHSGMGKVSPVSVDAVRLNVTATNGYDHAHVNEVRLYGADGVSPFPKQPRNVRVQE